MNRYRIYGALNRALEWIGAIPPEPEESTTNEPPPRTKADLVLEEVEALRSHVGALEAKVLSALTADTNVITNRIALLDRRVDELGASLQDMGERESTANFNVPFELGLAWGSDAQRASIRWLYYEGMGSLVESTIPMEPLDPVNLTDANLTDVGDERFVGTRIGAVGAGSMMERFVSARIGAVGGGRRAHFEPMTTHPKPRHVDIQNRRMRRREP